MTLPEMRGLAFDEETHVYTLDGAPIPSVTSIMRPLTNAIYDGVSQLSMYVAADRGTRAHEQVSNMVRYGVVESDADTEPYIAAFKRFCDNYQPTWLASEFRAYNKAMRYAGTIDLIGYVTPDDGNGVDIVDLKCTSQLHPLLLSVQLSAYAAMLAGHGVMVRAVYGLRLGRNGKYEFIEQDNQYKLFLHCLAIYNAVQLAQGGQNS